MQYLDIHSKRDHDGKKGEQQPTCEGHFSPCFWKLTGNCGIKEEVCKVLRDLLKRVALNLFPQRAVIGLAWENG